MAGWYRESMKGQCVRRPGVRQIRAKGCKSAMGDGRLALPELPSRFRNFKVAVPVDRLFLTLSTLCFVAAVIRTVIWFRARVLPAGKFNFMAIGGGFILQTAFLSVRGHQLGRCPLTNLFEVFVFLAWSVALIYMLVGPAYRLSLMGAFTAPLVIVLQGVALLAPIDVHHPAKLPANPWLE